MKFIYKIFSFINTLFYYLTVGWKEKNKPIHFVLLFIFLLPLKTSAQNEVKHDPLRDPITGGYPVFANSVEIISLRDSLRSSSEQVPSQSIFDLNYQGHIVESSKYVPGSGGHSLNEALWLDCVAADFDGDGIDEILTGWVSPDGYVRLDMSEARRSKPDEPWQWDQCLYQCLESSETCIGPIRLLALNLDSTFRKEILVCTPISDASIRVVPYFLDKEGQALSPGAASYIGNGTPLDIASGDLNGDGRDELVHVFNHNYTYISLSWYNYNPVNRGFQFGQSQSRPTSAATWDTWKRLNIVTGDFRNLGRDEIVVSITLKSGDSGRQAFDLLSGYWLQPPGQSPEGWSWGNGLDSDLFAADLNPDKDDGDELIVAGPGEVAVLKFTHEGVPYYCGDGNARTDLLHSVMPGNYKHKDFLAVADMDADTSNIPGVKEIIVAERKPDSTTLFRVLIPEINANADITGLSQKAIYNSEVKSRLSKIAVGDFDGDALRLGAPTLVTKESVYQPIVQLNVPPTHFDYLNDQLYDVCNIHGPASSEFRVTYTETQSQTAYFSSELAHDWGVSTELSGGFSLFGVEVKSYIKAAYDRGYYGSHSETKTITASQVTSSTGDDWILATVTDYDFWEYPLYGMGKCLGNVLVQIAHPKDPEWFPSRNVNARNWIDNHEVGNIFSYPRKEDIDGRVGSNLLTSFTGKYISTASSGSWTLDLANQSINSEKLTNAIGTEVGASVSGWGIEANVAANYSREEIITHTSSATDEVVIEVDVSETDKALGDTDYLITPYMYWGQNGAMVIDYAVDPSSSGDSIYGTFWDKHYLSKSDPGLLLPWRLDSYKGIGGTENLKLFCKSLRMSPRVPSAGDTVYIEVYVHNFSLKNTDEPITVRFYLGDPDNEGTPIESIDGRFDLHTNGSIASQNNVKVGMEWVVPKDLEENSKVYAVIDPDDEVSEIHEDNNIGFRPLHGRGLTGMEQQARPTLSENYILHQNYPNPFNPTTTLGYEIPKRCYVYLTVYDIYGRKVKTLVDQFQDKGYQSVIFDAADLASGVYLYRLKAGSFSLTKKLIVLR